MIEFFDKHTKIAKIQQKLYENRPVMAKNDQNTPELTLIVTKDVKEMFVLPQDTHKYIRAANTKLLFKMDLEDWERAKHIPWYDQGAGSLTTFHGQTFEDYVGIIGARLYRFNPYDKRRECYHNC